MTTNPSFPSPTPTLAAVQAAITALQGAQVAALARTKGTIAVRNEKRWALVVLLDQLRGCVQSVADANPEADGGKTWTPLPVTLQAKTTRTGLAVASIPQFRYRAVTKGGEGDWSQPVSVVVK
jgi:hypothetical protein